MRSYRNYMIVLGGLFILYFVVQYYKPNAVDWRVTLSESDKIPYGSYLLAQNLKVLFPDAKIEIRHVPVYNVVHNSTERNTAYFLIGPEIKMTETDENELLDYVSNGNYVFLSAFKLGHSLPDTLHFKLDEDRSFILTDSARINFVNPHLKRDSDYTFLKGRINGYFSKIDTINAIELGINQNKQANYIKINYGEGAFYIHAAPLCFSNYFFIFRGNNRYITDALSCLPADIKTVYWDEYYKGTKAVNKNPLVFILKNDYLKWAFRIGVLGLLLFILFEMKRRQRVIPVLQPLKNTSLEFVETVGNVYFNQKDNKVIALKKIHHFFDAMRTRFYLSASMTEDEIWKILAQKAGVAQEETQRLRNLVEEIRMSANLNDEKLLQLNKQMDIFYEEIK